jgi:type I restriction enzyme S subunit
MNIVGPPLGKVAIVTDEFPDWNINQAITLFRPNERITSKWIYYFLCSGYSIAEIIHETRGSAGQTNISLSQCRNFVFPIPPLEEQSEIVRRVESLFAYAERLEARYRSAAECVEQLTPSLLAKAFGGELVEQNPNDEPASALLDRIRATESNMPKDVKKLRESSPMNKMAAPRKPKRKSIVQTLQEAGQELSSEQLFVAAGYPSDAESELVEEFFVEVRDALLSKQIRRERRNNLDWFSLLG